MMNTIDKKKYIHALIGIMIMFGFGLLPAPAPITQIGMQITGIFLGLLYLWSTSGYIWTSMLGLLALVWFEYAPLGAVISGSLGNPIAFIIVFILVFLGAIDDAGITQALSKWFVTRKIINGHPWIFTFIILFATYILSILTNCVLIILLMWGILYKISDILKIPAGDKYISTMLLGIIYAGCAGAVFFPFKDGGLMISGTYTAMSSGGIMPQGAYMSLQFILSLAGILGFMLLMKVIFRVDLTAIKTISSDMFMDQNALPLSRFQKMMAFILAAMIGFILLTLVLPKDWWLARKLSILSPMGIIILFFCLVSIIRKDGKPIVNFQEMAKTKVTWDIYFLVASATYVSSALVADVTGVKEFLSISLNPIFSGMSAFGFMATIVLGTLILTNLANNGVVAIIFLTIASIFCGQFDTVSLAGLAALIGWVYNLAFLLPASSFAGAMLYGNEKWITPKEIIKYSIPTIIMLCLVVLLLGIPLANTLF